VDHLNGSRYPSLHGDIKPVQPSHSDPASEITMRDGRLVLKDALDPGTIPVLPISPVMDEVQGDEEEEEEIEGDYDSGDDEVIVPWGAPVILEAELEDDQEVEGIYSEDELFEGEWCYRPSAYIRCRPRRSAILTARSFRIVLAATGGWTACLSTEFPLLYESSQCWPLRTGRRGTRYSGTTLDQSLAEGVSKGGSEFPVQQVQRTDRRSLGR